MPLGYARRVIPARSQSCLIGTATCYENCNFDWQMEDTQSDLEALSLVDYTDTHRSPEYGCPELGLDVELDLGLDVELDI